ncbi:Hypothetical protein A7982_06249 [Minicystis rosea]|nr:Hypothetical protein A7982_06249 [Minicystis rosea]
MRLRTLTIAAFFLPALAACGSSETTPGEVAQPVEYQLKTHLDPGDEVERCQFVKAPPGGLLINRDEVHYTQGSHHVLLYETPYTDIPTTKTDGTVVDTSGVFDCSDGPTNGWNVSRVVAGSQNANGDSAVDLPPGIAVRVPANAVLLMNAHYVNASADALDPTVSIKLHTISESEMKEEGDVLFLYNIFIKVDAQSKADARMRCPVHNDITITTAQSHMHARGVDYEARVGDAAPFYTNTSWANVPVARFEQGFKVKAGEVLDYRCSFNNAGQQAIYQGPRSTDEMCMLIGSYYPVDRATAACSADVDRPDVTNALGAEWVGSGTATCAATAQCVQAGATSPDFFKHVMGCVTASDPAVSKEVSNAIRCIFMSSAEGKDPQTACVPQISACIVK